MKASVSSSLTVIPVMQAMIQVSTKATSQHGKRRASPATPGAAMAQIEYMRRKLTRNSRALVRNNFV